jgi:hypothetical protein
MMTMTVANRPLHSKPPAGRSVRVIAIFRQQCLVSSSATIRTRIDPLRADERRNPDGHVRVGRVATPHRVEVSAKPQ